MKATCLLLLTLSWAALTLEIGYASENSSAPHRPVQDSAGRAKGRLGAASPRINRPKQLPNRRQGSPAGNPVKLGQPGSSKSVAAAKSAFVSSETVNNTLASRAPSALRPTAPSFTNARHRSPNPAVVAGAPNAHRSDTAALNGTRMNRRM